MGDRHGRTINVLLIDDDAANRSLLSRYLGRDPDRDYALTSHPDGRAAVEACRSTRFDCLLIDYQLAEGTGAELVETLRLAFGWDPAPVLLMTADDGGRARRDAERLGVAGLLSKRDIGPASLREAIAAAA